MESLGEYWKRFRTSSSQSVVLQVVNLGLLLSGALVAYKILSFITQAESPIVVVLSESMEPTIRRGDLLFLSNYKAPYTTGDIVVYLIPGREVPIVHRVVKVHEDASDSDPQILTKGDNNFADDIQLYEGRRWLTRELIIGKAYMIIPYAGMLTIWLNDYPPLKFALLGSMSLFALLTD
uniref:Signal peptidase complex catalytic subunit SEC11 n=2 Tax=Rhodosorus marinus TaxID=101924 RepID=A0A7S3EPB9_9RHOD|mmetsp:Transcript_6520/g.27751  ORF Transcript_6520/g.27751 Transcript_6520/m.27751 type:complete len:179 (+) Transcript_6520:1641-2177(+)|eukprot:CAMPEP_0113958254 /NCGR_PEP_ID=MMETSP0011_2-20120614/3280_1 /TAXON_ID=101924 /ORGANISM="Rhodosorus marinus" /LENGTH=178 /DNA_ID=CAMNT_0000969021 /DNA_START=1515 /DNA_END=2051 /DNA_ORIENTATION=+ /assembly_acc=CAM_ASM_000156